MLDIIRKNGKTALEIDKYNMRSMMCDLVRSPQTQISGSQFEAVPIRLLSGPSKAWLGLEGSILTYRDKVWAGETTIDIPVELASFSEKRCLDGKWLIAALLSPILLLGVGGAVFGLWHLFVEWPSSTVKTGCMGTAGVLGLLAFLVLLVRFFIRDLTYALHVAPSGYSITFWVHRTKGIALRQLVDECMRRKALVEEVIAFPMKMAVSDKIFQPWKRTVGLAYLAMLPALFTKIPWLLVLVLVPIGMHLHTVCRMARTPLAYRLAAKCMYKRRWDVAEQHIALCLQQFPDYLPAHLAMIELKMRKDDNDGAESALAEIQNDLDVDTLQSIQHDIVIRRRIAQRKRDSF